MQIESRKILIQLDTGLLARIERERLVEERLITKRPARTVMIRRLIVEAMDTRCVARAEPIPEAIVAEPANDQGDDLEGSASPAEDFPINAPEPTTEVVATG